MKNFGLNRIFVEGKSDKRFIEALLFKYFEIDCNDKNFSGIVISTEGKDKLKNQPDLVSQERKLQQAKNLIIFDADFQEKGGGANKRRKEYEELGQRMDVIFKIYLLPNDEEDGELENLVETCFKEEFRFFEDCWKGMITCFERQQEAKLKLPNIDGYIHSYTDLLEEYKQLDYGNRKTEAKFLDEGLWNLKTEGNNKLKKLIDFIENNFFED